VQSLELAHGVALFDRSGRRPVLTGQGQVLVAQARRILGQVESLERIANAMSAGLEPRLVIAIDPFVPTLMIINLLRDLRSEFPDIAVTLHTEGIGAAERRVIAGTAAIGICALVPLAAMHVEASEVGTIAMVPVAARDHPLALLGGPLGRDQLAQHVQLVLTDPAGDSGPSFNVVSPAPWRFADMGRRLDFLLGGIGWGFMPLQLVKAHLAAGDLVMLPVDPDSHLLSELNLFVIQNRKRVPGLAAQWLLERIKALEWGDSAVPAAKAKPAPARSS
jgi:DNA-binding transcriptional LysR family regulator